MREIKKEIEVLEMLYQNLLMIKETIVSIIKIQEMSERIISDLKELLLVYKRLIQAVRGMLKTRNKDVKDLSVGEKIATYVSIKINMNKSAKTCDIAKMLIQDIKLRTDDINRIINDYIKVSKTIINISNRIILANEKCNKKLEKYVNS